MNELKKSNAIIESVSLQIQRGGMLTAYLHLDYGGSGQSFGGHALYLDKNFKHHKGQVNYAGHFLLRCMEICGVEDWKKMKGKSVRVKYQHSKVHEIGHITKDNWFNPEIEFEALENQRSQ